VVPDPEKGQEQETDTEIHKGIPKFSQVLEKTCPVQTDIRGRGLKVKNEYGHSYAENPVDQGLDTVSCYRY
jgi:hypothetical protein